MAAQEQSPQVSPPPAPQTLTPPVPPQPVSARKPDPLPSPADAPIPDLGTLPSAQNLSKSRVGRALDRLAPKCLDAATHTCWGSSPGDQPQSMSEKDRQFAKEMEVGDYYLKDKNYRGAEMRFRAALTCKSNHAEATFKLAQSLDKQGDRDEAQTTYQSYLKLQPEGAFAAKAQKALNRLEASRR